MKKIWLLFLITLILGCGKESPVISNYRNPEEVQKQIDKLAPVKITFDHSLLDSGEQEVLRLLVEASRKMDEIFLRQVYEKNIRILRELEEGKNPDYAVLLKYFKINYGPFDRLNHDEPFINLTEMKPAGANYYPNDLTKEEFEQWLKNHPEDEEAFTSNYTVIRRKGDRLIAVPYSEEYREFLEPAAEYLKKAASLCQNPSLKKYLLSRAEAFLSNDYFQSDMDWMDLKDHKIEVVIGPYEVYEDNLFGYKAAFESFVTIVDPAESQKLSVVAGYLEQMEKNLPIPDEHKNFERGMESPILVVQEVYTAGDTRASVQTTAFNLPNDERVRQAKGSKKVMLKNVARAKFDQCWIPIVNRLLDSADLPYISFEAYFNHVLMHEMSHGLGPGIIRKNGRETTVNKELKELYSTIEEAKADILGVYNLQFLIDQCVFPKEMEKQLYVSFLGGIFRSVRFGINEAHGGANAIALNYLLEKKAFLYDDQHVQFRVNWKKVKEGIKELARELLMIQATGDYGKAGEFIAKYRQKTPALEKAIEKVKDVPVDIFPIYEFD